jgi:hypothetical protein
MRRAIQQTLSVWVECFDPTGPVIEIGSRYAPGYQWLGDICPLFPGRDFIGCDIRPGPGVDRQERAERLSGMVSLAKERARDILPLLLGRAEVGVQCFDPTLPDRYLPGTRDPEIDAEQ